MKRRGQAAMEFLMTYGWAILAAIVAIGVLAYFGVFSSDLAGSNAVINNPYYAAAWNADTSGVRIDLVNNGGDTLVISDIGIVGTGSSTGTDCDVVSGEVPMTLNAGEQAQANMTDTCTLTSGDNYAGDITITYTKSGSSLTQTTSGNIRVPVQ